MNKVKNVKIVEAYDCLLSTLTAWWLMCAIWLLGPTFNIKIKSMNKETRKKTLGLTIPIVDIVGKTS